MKENFEKEWEKSIDDLFIKKGKQAGYLVETNWKYYLKYFFLYFTPYIAHNNSQTLLLDVGCGSGIVTRDLLQYGFKISGVDFSSQAIQFARSYNLDINFQHSSIYSMPFPDQTFDIVICLGVLQTVKDPDKALSEMKRLLKKNGLLIIRTLNSLSLSSIKTKRDNPSFSFYNPFTFRKEIRKKGFKVFLPKGIYFFPAKLHFLTDLTIKTNLYKMLNFLFFPISVFFSHSFYIEAIKK